MKLRACYTIALVLSVALAAPLWAAEEGHGGGDNIFAGDLGNILWTLVIFGLVLFVLGKYAWGPILSNLQAREDFIHDALAKAKADRDEAKAALARYEAKITGARAEATAIVEEGRRDADVVRQRIEQEARAEATKTLARVKREIEIAKETAVKELYALSGTLATSIAARIVERELKPEDHERLILDAISELEQVESH